MKLSLAHLNYGSTVKPIVISEEFPIPQEFDFDRAEECARKILAIMCNASGGSMKNCGVRYHKEQQTANITSDKCHVYYCVPGRYAMSVQTLMQIHAESTLLDLGSITTSTEPFGWEAPTWEAQPAMRRFA